jgi:hypothetical protein
MLCTPCVRDQPDRINPKLIDPNLLKSPISRATLLAGACFLAIVPFFCYGTPSGHDFEFHTFSWMEVLNQWKHGILYPRWAALAHWGYGEARFLFYPPASWTLGAALGAILPWKTVPGAYCFLALLLAATSMYRLAREWLSPSDALFAAAFYALNPYHLLIVYWRSAYAELLAAALLPLLVRSLLRLTEVAENDPGVRPTLMLSLVLAGAWLTNEPAAIMIHYSAAALVLFLAFTQAKPAAVRTVLRTAAATLLGAGLAAFYLLPAIYERSWINLSEVLSPGVRPQDNFLFTTLADPDHNRFNLLVSTVALAEIVALIFAIYFARKRQEHRRAWIILSSWAIVVVLLMLKPSYWLWQRLPELRFVQLPFRWLLCMNAALAILLLMATKRWSVRFAIFTILLAALFISGHHFQPPWWEKAADFQDMNNAIADGSGYDGTDEYVPAGDDPYELNKTLPPISAASIRDDSAKNDSPKNDSPSDDSAISIPAKIQTWESTEKHFTVHASAKQNLIVRLFSYPAFEVTVNGKPTTTSKTDVTGLIVIPVDAGDNDIHIHFSVTKDRLLGDIVSSISLAILVSAWFSRGWIRGAQPRAQEKSLVT